jgi:pimeloyl-ACP methyl ester carboxylesterase
MEVNIPRERELEIDGAKVCYHELGAPDGQPLVLLHGYISSSYSWRHVWPPLARTCRIYIVDLPGYGKSEPLKGPWTIDGYAKFLSRLFAALELENAIVVGAQMGGSIAAWFATKYPELVKGLVLLAAGAMGERRTNMWLYKLVSQPILGRAVVQLFPRKLFFKRLKDAYVNQNRTAGDSLAPYFRTFKKTGHIQTRIALKIRESFGDKFQNFEPHLKQIVAPTLLIWGDLDPLVPLSSGHKFKRAIVNSSLAVIRNCGDFPQEEYPEVVATHLLNFIRTTESANSIYVVNNRAY